MRNMLYFLAGAWISLTVFLGMVGSLLAFATAAGTVLLFKAATALRY